MVGGPFSQNIELVSEVRHLWRRIRKKDLFEDLEWYFSGIFSLNFRVNKLIRTLVLREQSETSFAARFLSCIIHYKKQKYVLMN